MSQNTIRHRLHWAAAALPLLAVVSAGPAALAQQANADATIDERLELVLPGPVEALDRKEAILTGREDIVLLKERDFFTLFASTSMTATSNPGLTNSSADFDQFFSFNVGLRASTEIAETYRVHAEVSTFGAQYFDNDVLNYAGFAASFGFDRPIGQYRVGMRYAPQVVYDDQYSDHAVTLHRIDAFASRQVAVTNTIIAIPRLTLSGIPADPSDYSRLSAEAAVPLYYQPAPSWLVSVTPQVYVRHYPNFFESVTGESRTDAGGSLSFGITWAPHKNINVSASVAFAANRSTVDSLSYEAISATPTLQAVLRF